MTDSNGIEYESLEEFRKIHGCYIDENGFDLEAHYGE